VLIGGFLFDGGPFLRRVYSAGLRGHDGISIHPYSGASAGWVNPAKRGSPWHHHIRNARRIQRTYGDRSGLYITEFGFATCPASPCTPHQGRWLANSFRAAKEYPYVKALTFFSMFDFADPAPVPFWDMRMGVLGKPSYRRVRQVFKELRRGRR
jgi:hypothetical protein